MKNIFKLIISIIVSLSAGTIGSQFTQTSLGSWYDFLNKPPITPPNLAFPIAWTLLFILMGVSL